MKLKQIKKDQFVGTYNDNAYAVYKQGSKWTFLVQVKGQKFIRSNFNTRDGAEVAAKKVIDANAKLKEE